MIRATLLTSLFFIYSIHAISQSAKSHDCIKLSLNEAINLATDSSLSAYKAKYLYLSGYWRYRTFKAERLPSLSLETSPFQYNRNIVKRYDSQSNMDVYKTQQSLNSSARLTLNQNIDLTGGSLYIDSYMGYLQNFGANKYQQFSTAPFRIGYSQSLFGFNNFKWSKMVEPLKYEKAKKEFLYNTEEIALNTSVYFFDLALSQTLLSLAKQNLERCDTLFKIGLERYRIGSISESELLTLKLEKINAINNIGKAELNFKKSHTTLSAFMNINNQIIINLNIPEEPLSVFVNEDDAIRFARENNPTYLSQKENILMAKQNLDQVKKSRFSASVSGSIGFNQVANNIKDAYLKPLQQDIVNVGFNIPLVDWGVRKGKKVMAKKNLELAMMDASRTLESFEDEIANAAREYNLYLSQIETAKEARDIANLAFAKTKKLFLIGKIDVNTVNIAMGRLLEAESNYITSLKNYWCSYRNLRKLTLYDFVNKKTLTAMFEYP